MSKFGLTHWMFEIWSHFHLQYFFATAVALICFLLFSRFKWAAFGLVALAYQASQQYIWFDSPSTNQSVGENFRVLQYNVLYLNNRKQETVDWIISDALGEYDLIALVETSEEWKPQLATLDGYFPHSVAASYDGPFGLVVYSRWKIVSSETLYLGTAKLPSLELKLVTPRHNTPLSIFVTHPYPPLGNDLAAHRNSQLIELAKHIAVDESLHKLAIGDFNLTPFSPWFDIFRSESGLYEVQQGRGPAKTWPTTGLLNILGGIYIDLAFATENIAVLHRAFSDVDYSDHRAIYTEFWINKP